MFFTGCDKGDEPAEPSESELHLALIGAASAFPLTFSLLFQHVVFSVCVCKAGKQTPMFYPSSVTSARAMMLFNLGSAYCLRSEYEKARKCLHQVGLAQQPHHLWNPSCLLRTPTAI